MDEARALTIVSALANGVNPLTGELFAVDSPYQSPDVIRALYCAVRALEAAGRRRTRGAGAGVGQRRQAVDGGRGSSAAVGVRRRSAARGAGAGARPHARRHSGTPRPAWPARAGRRSPDRRAGQVAARERTRRRECIPCFVSCARRRCTMRRAPMCSASLHPPLPNIRACACAARSARQHHRQVERRRPGARHRSAGGRAAGLGSSGGRHDHRRRAGKASPLAAGAVRARARGSPGVAPPPRRDASGADVNLMLEHVWLQYLSTAPINVAVPNPEWFDRHDRRFLAQVDSVWAKTSVHARAVPRARLQHDVHRLRQRRSLRERHREAAHVLPPGRQEHDEGHGSPGARLAAPSRVAAPDPGATQGRRRREGRRAEHRRARRLLIRAGTAHAAERKSVPPLPVAHRRLGALHRRGDGRRRRHRSRSMRAR